VAMEVFSFFASKSRMHHCSGHLCHSTMQYKWMPTLPMQQSTFKGSRRGTSAGSMGYLIYLFCAFSWHWWHCWYCAVAALVAALHGMWQCWQWHCAMVLHIVPQRCASCLPATALLFVLRCCTLFVCEPQSVVALAGLASICIASCCGISGRCSGAFCF